MRWSQIACCSRLVRSATGSATSSMTSSITGLFVSSVLLSTTGLFAIKGAIAQPLPSCQPPRANEYLLLVPNQKSDTQSQLRAILPSSAMLTVCDYLSSNVVRVESFANADVANAWAQYLTDVAGLRSFVARPSHSSAAAPAQVGSSPAAGGTSSSAPSLAQTGSNPNSEPNSEPNSGSNSGYNPQPLGAGYAVVVNYFNRPEIAADVHQITTHAVGLVSFNQRPYLLAIHTTDAAAASTVLRRLSDRGLTASIVDSHRVILLLPAVVRTGGR